MIPTVMNQDREQVILSNIKDLSYKRGGKEYCANLPWYSADGKEWFVEHELIKDYIK